MRVLPLVALLVSGCSDAGEVDVKVGDSIYEEQIVLFYSASGGLMDRVTVGEDVESIRGPMVPGGSVIRIERDENGGQEVLWMHGVQPGDQLDLSPFRGVGGDPDRDPGVAQVKLPPLPPGSETVSLFSACDGGLPGSSPDQPVEAANIYDLPACDYTFDLAVLTDGDPTMGLLVRDVVADEFRDVVVEGELVPVEHQEVETGGAQVFHATVIELRDDRRGLEVEFPAGSPLRVPRVPGMSDELLLHVYVVNSGLSQITQRLTPGAALAAPLASVTGLVVDESRIRWESEANGDLILVERDRWTIVAPPETREIRTPALPDDLADTWGETTLALVEIVDSDRLTSWDQVRQLHFARWRSERWTEPASLFRSVSLVGEP